MTRAMALLLMPLFTSPAFAQDLPPWGAPFSTEMQHAYQIVRAREPLTIDGKLDEAQWERAQVMRDFVVPPKMDWIAFSMTEARPASSETRVRMMWDDQYLYFGAEMQDRDIYCVTGPGHDNPFGADDIIELFIKPNDELPYYWELHVLPSGGTRDYWYARRSAGPAARWMPHDSGMEAQVTVVGTLDDWTDEDSEWVVEMRVPWSAFDRWGGRPAAGDQWRMMVSRYDYSVYLEDGVELSAAAPLPWQNFHLFEYYPYVTFLP